MTAIEYMERTLSKNRLNYIRAYQRGARKEELDSIRQKISYYEQAVDALKNIGEIEFDYNAED